MSEAPAWDRVRSLFAAVVATPPEERAALLRESSGADAALRQEVESLLAAYEAAGGFLASDEDGAPARAAVAAALAAPAAPRLTPGARLGVFEIVSAAGRGGMGEVYQARDTRLDRIVALKVLPLRAAGDAQARERFEREARAISRLNHPHICTLHDIGHHEGVDYLVMEYLEGQTLAARLAAGRGTALPVGEAVAYAAQMAEALGAAHRQGIVHRDLKPSNVMLVKGGGSRAGVAAVKLLDFGLARLRPAGVVAVEGGPAPEASSLTARGMIVGTPQYMAPEQVRGEEADARSDIWALGAVLYEMLTGRRAFEGGDSASVMAAILEREPAPLPPAVAGRPTLQWVLQRCLAKNPEDRWQHVDDVRAALAWTATAERSVSAPLASGARLWPVARVAAALALLVSIIGGAGALWMWLQSGAASASAPSVRYVLPPPPGMAIKIGPATPQMALSPDGRRIAFCAGSVPEGQLYVQALDSLSAEALAGTEGAIFPFWSPDGTRIAFHVPAAGKLMTVDAEGGVVRALADFGEFSGGAWNRDDVLLFRGRDDTITRVPAGGGEAVPVTRLDATREETAHNWPVFLPDGRHFLFLALSARPEHRALYVGHLDGRPPKRLMASETRAVFVPPDRLLWVRAATLVAQRLDLSRLEMVGRADVVVEGVGYNPMLGTAAFSATETMLAYRAGGAFIPQRARLAWVDGSGRVLEELADATSLSGRLAISRDGRFVLQDRLDTHSGRSDVWLMDLRRTGVDERIALAPAPAGPPAWMPDGALLFPSRDGAGWGLFRASVRGASAAELLWKSADRIMALEVSRDGRFVVVEQQAPDKRIDLLLQPLAGGPHSRLFTDTTMFRGQPSLSPDGRWLAFASDESGGRREIYVAAFPRGDRKWRVSIAGAEYPVWRADGKALYYSGYDGITVVTNTGVSGFEPSAPIRLFEARHSVRRIVWAAAGGDRFLAFLQPDLEMQPPVTILTNWQTGVRRPVSDQPDDGGLDRRRAGDDEKD